MEWNPRRMGRSLARIAIFATRRPGFVLSGALLTGIVTALVGLSVIGELHTTSDEFNSRGSESSKARWTIEADTGAAPAPTVVVLVHVREPLPAPRSVRAIAADEAVLRSQPGIARVVGYLQSPEQLAALVSHDSHSTVLAASLDAGVLGTAQVPRLIRALRRRFGESSSVLIGGSAVAGVDLAAEVRSDVRHIEPWVLLVLGALLLGAFRSPRLAGMPLLVGVLTIVEVLAILRGLLFAGVDTSLFTLATVSGLSLGLGIDYSLLIVSRFRQEIRRRGDRASAIEAALAPTARTIGFSALIIASSLATLIVFPTRFIFSVGLDGCLSAIIAAANSLLLAPALLTLFGERIAPIRRRERRPVWSRLPGVVVRYPLPIAITIAALLIALGVPALGLQFRGVDGSALPPNSGARLVDDALKADFAPEVRYELLTLVVRTPPDSVPITAAALGLGRLGNIVAHRNLRLGLQEVAIVANGPPLSSVSQRLVRVIRRHSGPLHVEVTSPAANYLDQQESLRSHLPAELLMVALCTFGVMFAMTGSIVLPAKALLMNALTFSATFGVVVLIFQDGYLADLLGVHQHGALEASQPIIAFAAVFGLSTDYNIFVLSRIQEAMGAGREQLEAIAEGLCHSGPVVSTAALCFCVSVAAFATSNVVLLQETSLAVAIAVALDATLIRALLMPALMALLGRYNWWAPRPNTTRRVQSGDTGNRRRSSQPPFPR